MSNAISAPAPGLVSAGEIFRESAIGSSEIAGVCEIPGAWCDRWQIYARRRRLIDSEPETDRMRYGKIYQRATAEIFSAVVNIPHEWSDRAYYPEDRPYMRASVDAFLPSIAAATGALEIKWVALDQAGEWEKTYGEIGPPDGIPEYYLAQVQWQLSAHLLPYAYVAAMIGGNDLRIYRVPADLDIQFLLALEAERFWRTHLLGGVPPELGHSHAARDYIKRKYPREREPLRAATQEEIALLTEYADVRAEFDPLKKRKEALEDDLKAAVADAAGIESERGRFTWKKTADRRRQSVNWQKLAESQIDSYPADVQATMIAEHTETEIEIGERRLHWKDFRKEAA